MSFEFPNYAAWANEYSLQSSIVQSANVQFLPHRLADLLDFLENQDPNISAHIVHLKTVCSRDDVKKTFTDGISRHSSGHAPYPINRNVVQDLSTHLWLFDLIASRDIDFTDILTTYFVDGGKTYESYKSGFTANVILPFDQKLKRYIETNFDEDPPAQNRSPLSIPASDRIVPINHNSPNLQEAMEAVDAVITELGRINEIEPEEREALKAEVSSGKVLLEAPFIRLEVLTQRVLGTLRYIGSKFSDASLAVIAERAISLVTKWIFGGS